MKRTFTLIAFTVFVWGCAKKVTPVAGTGAGMSSNNGTVINTPASTPAKTAEAPAATASTPASPTPSIPSTPEGTRTPATTTKTPEMMGQEIHNTKCGKCHGLKVVGDYTADRWVSIMQVMAPKARLTDAEKENVLAYVKANAKK